MPVLRSLQHFHKVEQERVAGNDIMPALLAKAAWARSGCVPDRWLRRMCSSRSLTGRQRSCRPCGSWVDIRRPSAPGRNGPGCRCGTDQCQRAHNRHGLLGLSEAGKMDGGHERHGERRDARDGWGHSCCMPGWISVHPKWMRDLSLEWVYRLWLEPRRLWKRYVVTNTLSSSYWRPRIGPPAVRQASS